MTFQIYTAYTLEIRSLQRMYRKGYLLNTSYHSIYALTSYGCPERIRFQ